MNSTVICPHCGLEISRDEIKLQTDFLIQGGVLVGYYGEETRVCIPNTVLHIKSKAFNVVSPPMVTALAFSPSVRSIETPVHSLTELEALYFFGGESQLLCFLEHANKQAIFGATISDSGIESVYEGKYKKLKRIYLGANSTPETPESLYSKIGSDARFIGGVIGVEIEKLYEEREKGFILKKKNDFLVRQREEKGRHDAELLRESTLASKGYCSICGKKRHMRRESSDYYVDYIDGSSYLISNMTYRCGTCRKRYQVIRKTPLIRPVAAVLTFILPR